MSRKRKNAGEGYGYMFHGSFAKKADAVVKERKRKGSFIRHVYSPKQGDRYLVLSPRTNPIKRKKKRNPAELVVMGANPDTCGAMVHGEPCSRKPGHRGPHLPQGATLRPRSRTPGSWHENPADLVVPAGTTITIRTNPTEVNPAGAFHPGLLPGRVQRRTQYGRLPFNRRVAAMVRKAARRSPVAVLERAYQRHRAGRSGRVKSGGPVNKLFHELYGRNPHLGLNPGDDSWMYQAAAQLYPGKDLRELTVTQLSKVAQLAAKLKRDAGVITRWGTNPSAAAIRESFTGMPAEHVTIDSEPHMPAGDYAQLGELLALYVKPNAGGQVQQLNFRKGSRPLVLSDESARQLWFAGGDQDIGENLGAFSPRHSGRGNLVELGQVRRIDYEQRKEHVTNPDLDKWRHAFGQETGVLPVLLFDPGARRLVLAGGEYSVRPEGIVN